MNTRELIMKTFRGERTDRVPISPFLYYNSVYEMFDYFPDMDTYYDPPDFDVIEKFVEMIDRWGMDCIHSLGSVWDLYAQDTMIDQSIVRAWDNWDVTVERERSKDKRLTTITIKTPEGVLRHVEKTNRQSRFLIVSAPQEHIIKTPKDFDILRKYAPPADFMDCRLIQRARKAVGEKGIVASCTNGVYNTLGRIFRNLEQVMLDPHTDEIFYREMMEYFTEQLIKRFEKMIQNGADVIEVAANLATSAVGPQYFQDYVLEYENRLLNAIYTAGALNLYHNCGDADAIMHLYNEMEIDCWGYVVGPPFGDVDLEKALETIRPDMALRGNIDQVEFLRNATPQEVEEKVRILMEKVKPRGNWILATSDFFFDGTPPENIEAFVRAGLEFGQY